LPVCTSSGGGGGAGGGGDGGGGELGGGGGGWSCGTGGELGGALGGMGECGGAGGGEPGDGGGDGGGGGGFGGTAGTGTTGGEGGTSAGRMSAGSGCIERPLAPAEEAAAISTPASSGHLLRLEASLVTMTGGSEVATLAVREERASLPFSEHTKQLTYKHQRQLFGVPCRQHSTNATKLTNKQPTYTCLLTT